jgi:hypothetical protein
MPSAVARLGKPQQAFEKKLPLRPAASAPRLHTIGLKPRARKKTAAQNPQNKSEISGENST